MRPRVGVRGLGSALALLTVGVGAVFPSCAHAQPPDTVWRPESGVAMLVWDSVIPMAAPGQPIDTVSLPFGTLAAFRAADEAGVSRVRRDGGELPPLGSGQDLFAMWHDAVEPGEVTRFEACGPGAAEPSCWAVALRRPAAPEFVVVAPRATVTDPTYRHSGETIAGRGVQLAHGRGQPADTIDLSPGDRLEVRVSPTPDSVWTSVLAESESWPASSRARTTRRPPGFVWTPAVPDGTAREWLVCAWWGADTNECRVVGLRGVGDRYRDRRN